MKKHEKLGKRFNMPEIYKKPRRRLFQLPEKSDTPLEVQDQQDVSMEPDLESSGFNETTKEEVVVQAEPDSLKDKMTRSIVKMLKKKGPPKANP